MRSVYDKNPFLDVNYEQFSIEQIVSSYNARNGKLNHLKYMFAEKIEYDYNTIIQPLGSSYTTTVNLKSHNPTS